MDSLIMKRLIMTISKCSRFQALKKWQTQTIVNATVSVDSFFLLSGMLVSYLLLRELERNKGEFKFIPFFLHRYLR